METSCHTMESLFSQLGLESSDKAITDFIDSHRLPQNIPLDKANFWSPAQAQFIRECWNDDADWAVLVDQLDAQLRD